MGSIAPEQNGERKAERRSYLITSPRTASNLFIKMLNLPGQTNVRGGSTFGGYFFMPVFMYRHELQQYHVPHDQLSEEHIEGIQNAIQAGANAYKEHLDSCQEDGKIAFVKEHINMMTKPTIEAELMQGTPADSLTPKWSITIDQATDVFTPANPTIIPDNVLLSFKPTILIRHPAAQFPSFLRSQRDTQKIKDTVSDRALTKAMFQMTVMRQLYDYLASNFHKTDPTGPWPLVIDSADLINHPRTVMKHYCDANGFDFASCKFSWEATTEEKMAEMKLEAVHKRMLSTINASTGILANKAMTNVDVDVEARKWKEEFGEEVGAQLELWVRAALPDYQYLYERRWDPVEKEDLAGESHGISTANTVNSGQIQVEAN